MKVGIGADQSGYWRHLVDFIQKKGYWQAELFTKKERLRESLQSGEIEFLFLQKGFLDGEKLDVPVLFFGDGAGELLPYQDAEQIYQAMEDAFSSQVNGKRGKKEQLLAVYSPLGRSGKTSFSLAYCKAHSFFYLGMEEYGTIGKDRSSMEEILYHIRNRKENLLETIWSLSEEWQGISMIPSPQFFSDIHRLQSEDFLWFCQQLRESEKGIPVMVDFGTGMLDHMEILDAFDKVYVPVLSGTREEEKMKVFQDMLLEVNGDSKRKLHFIQVPQKSWDEEGFLDEVRYLEGEGF